MLVRFLKEQLKMEKGLSLTELLVVCSVLWVVLGSVFGLLYFTQHSWSSISDGADAQMSTRLAANRTIRDLREAQNPTDGGEAIPLAEGDKITFYANVDSDSFPEKVRYYLNGQKLMRGVTQYNESTGDYSGTEEQREVADYFVTVSLQYFDEDSNELALPLDQAQERSAIRLIKVTLEADTNANEPPPPFKMESQVKLRNFID